MASKISNFFRGLVASGDNDEAGEAAVEDAVEYQGYLIRPVPRKHDSQWLTSGVIIKQGGEADQEHPFVRAETHASKDQANDFAIVKGKQIIDEQGDRLFPET
jgi:hypothetical protein